jgi:hypothetical protein
MNTLGGCQFEEAAVSSCDMRRKSDKLLGFMYFKTVTKTGQAAFQHIRDAVANPGLPWMDG